MGLSTEDVIFALDDGITVRLARHGDEHEAARHANNHKTWLNMSDRFPHPYREQDALDWIDITMDKERWQPTVPPDSQMVGESDEDFAQRRQDSKIPTQFAICCNDKFIGWCGLDFNVLFFPRSADIGYWLGEEHWGKGLMSKVAARLLQWGFDTFPWLVRIGGSAYSWNKASLKVLRNIGMQPEGVSRLMAFKDGKFGDLHRFVKFRDGFTPTMRE